MIKIYTTPTCSFCKKAKEYFKKQNIKFTEIDISKMKRYRNADFEKCSLCDLLQYCRGCPAVAFNTSGRFGAPDPQCWYEPNETK